MKKYIPILTALLLAATMFSACNTKGDNTQTTSQDTEQLVVIHVENMLKGEYEKVNNDMAALVKLQVTPKLLKQVFEETTAVSGEYLGSYTLNFSQEEDYKVYAVNLDYENNYTVLTLSYDKDNKIAGIWLKTQPKETPLEDNEKFAETEIKVGEYALTGVLTTPKNAENPPIVVMVQGSGASDYNETISANRPFYDIAHDLAENGIATLRFNKRFFQKPELAADSANITVYNEYLEDVYAAVKIAEETGGNVYVLGHSLGGMSVPKIAKDNPQVKGIISLAGSPRELVDIMYDQNVMAIEAMDTTQAQKTLLLQSTQKYYDQVKALTQDDGSAPFGVNAKYWLSLRELDTLNISKNLNIPMLILQGKTDFQVYEDKDFEYWKKELSQNTNATFKLYPQLNHLFMEGGEKGIIDIEVYNIPGKVSKEVTADISAWITEQENNK